MVQLFTTDRSFVLENIVKFVIYKIGASYVCQRPDHQTELKTAQNQKSKDL